MTIQLTTAMWISGSLAASGSQHTLDEATEAGFIAQGLATRVGAAPDQGGLYDPVYSKTINGSIVLVGPDGLQIPIGSDSILSTTHIKVSTLSAAITSGGVIPFDVAVRDDLLLFDVAQPGFIRLPAGVLQFRWGYMVKLSGDTSGVASTGATAAATRRVTSALVSGTVPQDEAALGVLDATLQYPGISAGAQALAWSVTDTAGATLTMYTPWIDIAGLSTAPSGVAGEDIINLTITHNAGAGALEILAGSSFWLETITPA